MASIFYENNFKVALIVYICWILVKSLSVLYIWWTWVMIFFYQDGKIVFETLILYVHLSRTYKGVAASIPVVWPGDRLGGPSADYRSGAGPSYPSSPYCPPSQPKSYEFKVIDNIKYLSNNLSDIYKINVSLLSLCSVVCQISHTQDNFVEGRWGGNLVFFYLS